MPLLGCRRVEPRVGDSCSATGCYWATNPNDLFHCKAVGGHTVYLTLCRDCYKFIQDHLEAAILLLHVDVEEAIVGQVMAE